MATQLNESASSEVMLDALIDSFAKSGALSSHYVGEHKGVAYVLTIESAEGFNARQADSLPNNAVVRG